MSNVNFSILPINEKEILEDKFNFHQLFTTSELLDYKKRKNLSIGDLTINLLGGVYYDSLVSNKSVEKSLYDNYKTRSGKDYWNYLPESQNEINTISYLFSKNGNLINMLSGINALETNFYGLTKNRKPSLYHFATHGFSIDNKSRIQQNINEIKYINDQLDLSGIILAGANKSWGKDRIGFSNRTDGILTSKEIATLDLSNCKLAILSACETGLGAQLSNDGIFGLQRGLKLAGVNNIITSLWSVPDKSTRELFEYFYSNLINGFSIENSLRLARKELRKKYTSPYYWGAFTLIK